MEQFLDFERAALDISTQIQALHEALAAGNDSAEKDAAGEIERLKLHKAKVLRDIYRHLNPWQVVQVARHPARPQPRDYIQHLIANFQPLAGDRCFGDDKAVLAGLGYFNAQPVAVLGVDKGKGTTDKVAKNFGMPRPDGYRKAKRIMELADKFNLPLLTFVDTPGAYPGVDAEARGQGQAIAACIETLLNINVPVVSTITGEGGSGGALALAVADSVLMLQYSVYSVISPEGCAAILWKDANKETVPAAADALKLTAQNLFEQGLIDGVIQEPVGGAHRDSALITKRVGEAVASALHTAGSGSSAARRAKFIGLTAI
ncbi:MAG: acetyl-CoA carboxylase carboxyltransferase subunit alpha [Alphaproteobacteria bacterium]